MASANQKPASLSRKRLKKGAHHFSVPRQRTMLRHDLLIPFSDPIWTRLYGPYGIQDVAGILTKLETSWDDEIAQDLFWEKLHHQEDLYPVTFAAFPWLWEIANKNSPGNHEVLNFFSFTMKCALSPLEINGATDNRGKFRGLSLNLTDHQHSWIPEQSRVIEEDMAKLFALENWYSDNCIKIAKSCVDAVGGKNDYLDAMLSVGYASLHGSDTAAALIIGWADKLEPEEMEGILRRYPLQPLDVSTFLALSKRLTTKNGALAHFLETSVRAHVPCDKTESFL